MVFHEADKEELSFGVVWCDGSDGEVHGSLYFYLDRRWIPSLPGGIQTASPPALVPNATR